MKKQISVYRVVRDPSFQRLKPKDEDAFAKERSHSWSFDANRECHKKWVELEMSPSDSTLKSPDIWEIVPGAFALERHAYEELFSSVEETQPLVRHLKCERRKLAVINSTLCLDCLNVGDSAFDDDDPAKIVSYSFDGEQLAISLFKIPQTKQTELYTLDGFDEEKDFKTLVEKFRFTGVQFEHLWTGDSFMDA